MGKRDGTILALKSLAASAAQNYRGISAPVEQNHHLLFLGEALLDLGSQFARDDLLVPSFLEFLPHVDDFNFGQRALLDAVRQLDERVLVLLGVVVGLQRRRRGT